MQLLGMDIGQRDDRQTDKLTEANFIGRRHKPGGFAAGQSHTFIIYAVGRYLGNYYGTGVCVNSAHRDKKMIP